MAGSVYAFAEDLTGGRRGKRAGEGTAASYRGNASLPLAHTTHQPVYTCCACFTINRARRIPLHPKRNTPCPAGTSRECLLVPRGCRVLELFHLLSGNYQPATQPSHWRVERCGNREHTKHTGILHTVRLASMWRGYVSSFALDDPHHARAYYSICVCSCYTMQTMAAPQAIASATVSNPPVRGQQGKDLCLQCSAAGLHGRSNQAIAGIPFRSATQRPACV